MSVESQLSSRSRDEEVYSFKKKGFESERLEEEVQGRIGGERGSSRALQPRDRGTRKRDGELLRLEFVEVVERRDPDRSGPLPVALQEAGLI